MGITWYNIHIWVRVKIQGMDQGPEPTHDPYPPIHTLIHTLWYCMIHTLDPYPWSIPLSHWRKTDALMLLFILILLLVLVLLLTRCYYCCCYCCCYCCYYCCYYRCYCCFSCLRCLRAAAAAPAGPALAAGAGSLLSCASGSWTNATSWVATTNSSTRCFLYF